MATLAAMLKARGHDVQGSDHAMYPPMSDYLVREAIRTFDSYRPEHITPEIDVVVVGNAISRGNPELEEVLDRKIRFVSLPELIRDQFLWSARSVVIAGNARKDHDDGADRVAARSRRPRPECARWRDCRELRWELPAGVGS